MVAATLFGLAITALVLRSINLPLRRLSEAMRGITGGDLAVDPAAGARRDRSDGAHSGPVSR